MTAFTITSFTVALVWLHKDHLRSPVKIQIPEPHSRHVLGWRWDEGNSNLYSDTSPGAPKTALGQGLTNNQNLKTSKVHLNIPFFVKSCEKVNLTPRDHFAS